MGRDGSHTHGPDALWAGASVASAAARRMEESGAEELPLVSVVIPARNEAPYIESCLRAVASQSYPAERLEVIVVDGGSTDGTAHAAQRTLATSNFAKTAVVPNSTATTPSNLNAGLRAAEGDYIARVDARSRIPSDYVERCVTVLRSRPDVVVTGGSQVARSRTATPVAVGIARALNNQWTNGLARYRSGRDSGPTDTVYMGFFRTGSLQACGGWNESFATNQDFELNRRLGRSGVVWFESGLPVEYVPRASLRELVLQYRRFGRWKFRYWQLTGDRPRPRQLVLIGLGVVGGASVGTAVLRRPSRLLAVVAAMAVLERSGASDSSATPLQRGFTVVAMSCVGAGWIGGILEEALRSTTGKQRRRRAARLP